jgi:hypothetical protein
MIQRTLITLFLFHVFTSGAAAQSIPYNFDTRPARGFMATSDQVAGAVDSIDVVNGKLHLTIPLASLPPGPGGSGFDLDLIYDSHLYDLLPSADEVDLTALTTSGGWTYTVQNYTLEGELRGVNTCVTVQDRSVFRYRIGLADGSQHALHLRGVPEIDGFSEFDLSGKGNPVCNQQPITGNTLTYYTTDGSFLKLETVANGVDWMTQTWTLYFPDGRRVVGQGNRGSLLYDANGNAVRINNVCNAECDVLDTVISDGFGRSIVINRDATYPERMPDEIEDRITMVGPNGSISWIVKRQLIHIGGDGRQYGTNGSLNLHRNVDFHHWVVTDVQLPLTSSTDARGTWNTYRFGYSDNADGGYGEIDFMRTPTGAQYDYSYLYEGTATIDSTELASLNSVSRKSLLHDGITDSWTYTFTDTMSTITEITTGAVTRHIYYDRQAYPTTNRGLVIALKSRTDRFVNANGGTITPLDSRATSPIPPILTSPLSRSRLAIPPVCLREQRAPFSHTTKTATS